MKKRKTGLFAAVAAALAATAMAVPVAQAATPAAGYEQFKGCPTKSEVPTVTVCTRAVITSGHFQMGSKDVPIENPLTLTGGVAAGGVIVANSEGGLSPVKQKVPGGLVGLTGLTWLLEFFGNETLTLYAETQLVAPPAGAAKQKLRVHLINPLLGSGCYIGSPTEPINLEMITGTTSPPPPNEPITGKPPVFSFDATKGIIHQDNGTFVDNKFAAPGANGCTLTVFGIPFSINGLANSQSGLPSPAGTNETVQNFDLETVPVAKVYPPTGG